MQRKIEFVEGEIYHIFSRGVEKRIIFEDNIERLRFIFSLYYFNDSSGNPVKVGRILNGQSLALAIDGNDDREELVKILCWALMPNHFHLLVQEIKPGGISAFMHRLKTSYSLYFNIKHERSGPLFSGPFGAVLITDDIQYTHVSRYIHLNPLEIFDPVWKERGYVEDKAGADKFLKGYKWSSLPDYRGENRSFASIIDKSSVMEYFEDSADNYWKFITDWSEQGSGQDGDYYGE